jgi:hypothetical protein
MVKNYTWLHCDNSLCRNIVRWSKLYAVPVWCIMYSMWWVTVTNHTPVWYWICALHIYVVCFFCTLTNILWLIFSFIRNNTRVRSRCSRTNTARRRESSQNNRRKCRMRYGLWGWVLPTYTLICSVLAICGLSQDHLNENR